MSHSIRLAVALLLLVGSLSACTTDYVSLAYSPPPGTTRPASQTPVVSVGAFEDARGTDANWLGAIRGGYGNPLKKLRSRTNTSEIVAEAFADGLKDRGVFADPGEGALELCGTIVKLDTSQYFNIEAHAHIDVRLIERDSGKERFSTHVRLDESEGGWGPGIFGSVENLRKLLERTLNNAVDQTLSNPQMRAAIASP